MGKYVLYIFLIGVFILPVFISCQKELTGDTGTRGADSIPQPPASGSKKFTKAYWWYSGKMATQPSNIDSIFYNAKNQIEKVIENRYFGIRDSLGYFFEYNAAGKITKMRRRTLAGTYGDNYDYVFYYNDVSGTRLDSTHSIDLNQGQPFVARVNRLKYDPNNNLKTLYSYADGILEDSVLYSRNASGKIDSFTIYHLAGVMGPAPVMGRKLVSSAIENPFSFLGNNNGYLLVLALKSGDWDLPVYYNMLIHQFYLQKDFILQDAKLTSGTLIKYDWGYAGGLFTSYTEHYYVNGNLSDDSPEAARFEYK